MGIQNSKPVYCDLCDSMGHIKINHTNCNYCLEEDHNTTQHQCKECNNLGHRSRDHCSYCDELHKRHEHTCTVCGMKGHQLSKEEHQDQCYICKVQNKEKIQYTHHTDGHLSYIGLINMSEDERSNFKYCNDCNKVVYTENSKCIYCLKEVPEMVRCFRKTCGYTVKNNGTRYCPYCGCLVI